MASAKPLAQNLGDARLESRGCGQRPAHRLPRKDHVEHLTILGALHGIGDKRDVRQLFVLVEPELHDDLELASLEVGLVAGAGDAPRNSRRCHQARRARLRAMISWVPG